MDKLVCVGKNYLDHAKELGDAVPEMPVLFLKPPSASLQAESFDETLVVGLPQNHGSVHPELEIVVRLDAHLQIDAVTLGLDMTLRDVQSRLKKEGHPWELAKVFRGAALIGPWIPLQEFPRYLEEPFTLTVSGKLRQEGRGTQMRLSPTECIRYAATHFPLCPGDALFTGTPAGVGQVQPGDPAELKWGNRVVLRVRWTA